MSSHIERRARSRAPTGSLARLLGWLFLGITIGVIVLFVMQIQSFNALAPPAPQTVPADADAGNAPPEEVVVSNARFTGFDKERQPYTVTARTARQDESDMTKVHLSDVGAEMNRKTGSTIAIRSNSALYDSKAKSIDLQGNVEISGLSGLTARMEKARVGLESRALRSEVPVTVVNDEATIAANGLEIADDGKRILFFNGVKATFRGANRKGSSTP